MKKRLRKKYIKLVGKKTLDNVPFPKIKKLTHKYGRYASIFIERPQHRKVKQVIVYQGNLYQLTRTCKAWRKVTRLKYTRNGVDIVDTSD